MKVEIRNLKELAMVSGLSQQEIANVMGWSKSLASQVANENYDGWKVKTHYAVQEFAKRGLIPEGYVDPIDDSFVPITIDNDIMIRTDNVDAAFALADNLIDEESMLSASIGMILGKAGFGKTTTIRRYAIENEDVIYILYAGYTKAALFKKITEELIGYSRHAYYENLKLIEEATKASRKLIIIDEADRVPLKILEDLRTLNEQAQVPLLLVGEESLLPLAKKADRIESRIRKPVVTFRPIDSVVLSTLYKLAADLELTPAIAKKLLEYSRKDFRVAVNDMQHIVKIMNQNGKSEVTNEVLDEIRRKRA